MTNILLVDDDEDLRAILREALEEEGYIVREASNGLEGLAALRALPAHSVVLLDQVMPKFSGPAVLRALEAEPELARRHAYLLLRARPQVSMPLLTWTQAHSIALVRKPFELDQILEHIRQAVQQLAEDPAASSG